MTTETLLETLHRAVLHLPVITTVMAAFFCFQLFSRYREKGGGLHLLWWGIGMVTYGIGTFTEATTTLMGWDPTVFRLWYVSGAFLGGYPLAQGSIYLLMNRRFAHASAMVVSTVIALASVAVLLTPLDLAAAQTHRLSGDVIEWQWVRLISPFINIYAVIFLVGGAVVSALRFRRSPRLRNRYLGNIYIAVGALLPGIGGSLTRAGVVEALYVTELVGLLLIWVGYRKNISDKPAPRSRRGADRDPKEATMRPYATLFVLGALLAAPALAAAEVAESPDPPADAESVAAEAAADEAEPGGEEPGGEESGEADDELASFFASTTVTATGAEKSVFEVSTPVTVLSEEEIERKLPENAVDLLRTEPGVDVDGVGPNQARPIIRGLRGLRVLFLQNGLRMNNPRRQTDFGEIPGLVDMNDVERVEVVRGPASVLYGTDAIGGVLNLITKEPSYAAGAFGGSVGLRYGTAGDYGAARATLQGGNESLAWRLGLSYRDSDDYEAADGRFGEIDLDDGPTVIDTGVQDDNVHGYLSYQLSDRHQLFGRYNRYRADETGFGFVEPELLGGGDDFRIQILYPFQEFDRYTVGWSGTVLESPLADSSEVQLYYQDNERQLANDIDIDIGPIFPGAPDSTVEADTLNFTDLETLGLRAEAIKLVGDRHLLTYGLEAYEDDSFNTDSSTTTTTLRFPFPPFEVVDVSTDDIPNAPNATNSSTGVFVQDEILLGDRLTVTAGARYQTVETRAEPTRGFDTAGLDFDDDAVVGSLNVSWGVTDYLRLVGGYGTAFRAPNIIERLFNGPTPEGAGFQILNPDLTSEESENIDLGLKYLRRNAVFELTFFRNDIADGIIQYFLSDAEIAELPQETQDEIAVLGPDTFVVQQRNASELRYEGVEAIVGYHFENGVSLGGNYTHIDGERLDSTNPPTGDVVGDKVNAYVRWEKTEGRPLWVEYRVRHNGSQDANLDPNEPPPVVGVELPSFTVHNLAAGATLSTDGALAHELTVILANLTDELYAEFSNATFFRPQPGRNVSVAYRLRF